MWAVNDVLLGLLQGWVIALLAVMGVAAGVFGWRVFRDWWVRRG